MPPQFIFTTASIINLKLNTINDATLSNSGDSLYFEKRNT